MTIPVTSTAPIKLQDSRFTKVYAKKSLAKYSFKRQSSTRSQALVPGSNHGSHRPDRDDTPYCAETRNLRDVWTIPVQPCKGAHFATFPEALAEICVRSGSREGDLVLDPFMGSGTVAVVAQSLNGLTLKLKILREQF